MEALFIHCHPEPSSFNAALTDLGMKAFQSRGYGVELSDLYRQNFDPVEKAAHYRERENPDAFYPLAEQRHAHKTDRLAESVKREIARLERADIIVLQFPIWWHSIPAMLKGWMDRVFISGGLYSSKMRYDRGYFAGKRVILSATTGAPAVSFEPGGRGGEISQILWSAHYSLYYMGFDVLAPHVSYGVQGHGFSYADDETFGQQMESAKSDWLKRLKGIETDKPIAFPGWDDWDELGCLKTADRKKPTSRTARARRKDLVCNPR